MAGSGPVSYGSPFFLACRYYSGIGYDGFSCLSRVCGKELSEVLLNLLQKSPSDPGIAESYTWRTFPASNSMPPEAE